MITNKQIKYIYTLAKKLTLNEEFLHEVIELLTGKNSIKKLTSEDAKLVIEKLSHTAGQTYKSSTPVPRDKKNVIYFITNDQQRKLRFLAMDTGRDEKALNALSNRLFRKGYKQLTTRQASKLIEACKEIFYRKPKEQCVK